MLAYWGFILSIGCYAALAIWRLGIARAHPGSLYLAAAFAGMAGWTAATVAGVPLLIALAEAFRDLSWLAYLYGVTRSDNHHGDSQTVSRRFCLLFGALVGARFLLSVAPSVVPLDQVVVDDILLITLVVRWLFALTGIAFAHYLYRATAPSTASGFRLIVVALGILWAYNLNLFTLSLLGYSQAALLSDFRGLLLFLLVPAFTLAARRKERWKVTLSRQATTQSLLLVGIGSYFVIIASATRALIWAGDQAADLAKILAAAALTMLVLALAFMPGVRAHAKALLIRNLFEHRYDYRGEWLRFSTTMGDRSLPGLSTEERAIRSMTEITESVGGVLLVVERPDRLALEATWQWPIQGGFDQTLSVDPAWLESLSDSARIVTLDAIRTGGGTLTEDAAVPQWLRDERQAWAAVPLVRAGRLVGIILIARPRVDRALDWEDFDLLKVIAQQIAVHLTDAQAQIELEEARRFDEFNRRFAFIIHDLKNVVSQLSLVSSNATEHGANPKFQAAMASTLQNATSKMSTLLARLSNDRPITELRMEEINAADLLRKIAQDSRAVRVLRLSIERDCTIRVDQTVLAEAIGHLVTNAIEASSEDATVLLSLTILSGMAVIAVEDHGCGMPMDFIRKELFKPFSSTKRNGFGIGAAEARTAVRAMGGDLDVVSVEGEGSRFYLRFPLIPS